MHYIIDGYNLLFHVENEVNPLKRKRRQFIETLNDILEECNIHATLVFDSHQNHGTTFPTKRNLTALEVLFSPAGLSADEYILERLRAEKHPQTQTVITSDKELGKQAKRLGSQIESIEVFFSILFKKKSKKSLWKQEKIDTESPPHFERLLQTFTNELRDKSSD